MVEIAQARVPTGRFRRASAEELPLPDGSFDAVVGNFVLLHLGHPDRAAAEARRVLRRGGRCAFTVWDSATVNRALGVFHDAVERAGVKPPADVPTGPPMFSLGESGAFEALLRDAGFEAITVAPCTGELRVDPAVWWEATLTSTPRTGSLISRQTAGRAGRDPRALRRAGRSLRRRRRGGAPGLGGRRVGRGTDFLIEPHDHRLPRREHEVAVDAHAVARSVGSDAHEPVHRRERRLVVRHVERDERPLTAAEDPPLGRSNADRCGSRRARGRESRRAAR